VSFDIKPTKRFYVLSQNSLLQCSSTARMLSLQSDISLLPIWPDGKTIHSLPYGSKFDVPPLFAYHEPTRGRVLVYLCAELVVFLGPISYRGHCTALISAFNIQVESPSQHLFRCNIVLSPCDHFQMSFNWLTLSTASQAQLFPRMISKSANALFRFLTTSEWLLPETTLRFFPAQGRHAPPSFTSARFNVITIAISRTLPALLRVSSRETIHAIFSVGEHS